MSGLGNGIRRAPHVREGDRAGLTVLELSIMMGLLLVVIVKASLVTNSILDAQSKEGAAIEVEDRARQVLDRIAYQVMSCDYETLQPIIEEPGDAPGVTYLFALGLADGEVVWSDPMEIALAVTDGDVYWRENAGLPAEREVIWTSWAREYLQGEIPNGVDDNGNGLIDENGLAFSLDGTKVTIRLSLEGPDGGSPVLVERTVTCRN